LEVSINGNLILRTSARHAAALALVGWYLMVFSTSRPDPQIKRRFALPVSPDGM